MLRSVRSFARTAALFGALLALPLSANAGDRFESGLSEGGFGSGAVFVGRGGQIDRSITFGFGEGRGVAVVGGRNGSFERYRDGRRYGTPAYVGSGYDGSNHRDGGRDRRYDSNALIIDRSFEGRTVRNLDRALIEARRERFEDRRRTRSDGSFVRLRDAGRMDRFERDPRYDSRRDRESPGFRGSRTLTTFDVSDWGGRGGAIGYGLPYDPAMFEQGPPTVSGSIGPKIIDVETERLDRRPIGPSGLDVVTTSAGSKIIRIAPGYRTAERQAQRRSAPTRNDGNLGLQPWSTGWLRYCQRTYPSFDPDLGTYVTENGRVRFCNAE